MSEEKINISVKIQKKEKVFDMQVDLNITVADLKTQMLEHVKEDGAENIEQLRIICKGRILKNEQALKECKFAEGMQIHLVIVDTPKDSETPVNTPTVTEEKGEAGLGQGEGAGQ